MAFLLDGLHLALFYHSNETEMDICYKLSFNNKARQAASSIYKPIILLLNAVYIYLRIVRKWDSWKTGPILTTGLVWAMTYFCYQGIILDHENMVSVTSSKVSPNQSQSNTKQKRLAGGVYLDILAVVLFIQFGSLWKEKLLWLLIIFPIWGGYTLYHTFLKGMLPSKSENVQEDPIADEKRRKRAERRRQKWS